MNINQVTVGGNMVRDPEVRYTPKGTAVCDISIAVNNTYKGKDGETKKETEYFDCTLWDRMAEIAGEYLKRGQLVVVMGRLKTEHWDDKQTGQKRSKIKIIAANLQMGPKVEQGSIKAPRPNNRRSAPAAEPEMDPDLDVPADSDIPF